MMAIGMVSKFTKILMSGDAEKIRAFLSEQPEKKLMYIICKKGWLKKPIFHSYEQGEIQDIFLEYLTAGLLNRLEHSSKLDNVMKAFEKVVMINKISLEDSLKLTNIALEKVKELKNNPEKQGVYEEIQNRLEAIKESLTIMQELEKANNENLAVEQSDKLSDPDIYKTFKNGVKDRFFKGKTTLHNAQEFKHLDDSQFSNIIAVIPENKRLDFLSSPDKFNTLSAIAFDDDYAKMQTALDSVPKEDLLELLTKKNEKGTTVFDFADKKMREILGESLKEAIEYQFAQNPTPQQMAVIIANIVSMSKTPAYYFYLIKYVDNDKDDIPQEYQSIVEKLNGTDFHQNLQERLLEIGDPNNMIVKIANSVTNEAFASMVNAMPEDSFLKPDTYTLFSNRHFLSSLILDNSTSKVEIFLNRVPKEALSSLLIQGINPQHKKAYTDEMRIVLLKYTHEALQYNLENEIEITKDIESLRKNFLVKNYSQKEMVELIQKKLEKLIDIEENFLDRISQKEAKEVAVKNFEIVEQEMAKINDLLDQIEAQKSLQEQEIAQAEVEGKVEEPLKEQEVVQSEVEDKTVSGTVVVEEADDLAKADLAEVITMEGPQMEEITIERLSPQKVDPEKEVIPQEKEQELVQAEAPLSRAELEKSVKDATLQSYIFIQETFPSDLNVDTLNYAKELIAIMDTEEGKQKLKENIPQLLGLENINDSQKEIIFEKFCTFSKRHLGDIIDNSEKTTDLIIKHVAEKFKYEKVDKASDMVNEIITTLNDAGLIDANNINSKDELEKSCENYLSDNLQGIQKFIDIIKGLLGFKTYEHEHGISSENIVESKSEDVLGIHTEKVMENRTANQGGPELG